MLVLASASPQRTAILRQIGVEHEVRPSDVAEADEGPPAAVAQENALRKAAAIEAPGRPVLGVDTIVTDGLEIWGKPPNEDAARDALRFLQGREHTVVSGFAVMQDGEVLAAGTAATTVVFRPLSEDEVGRYVATGEWEGRAGGYAIQGRGAALVREVHGDYLNVVGLPVAALAEAWPALLS